MYSAEEEHHLPAITVDESEEALAHQMEPITLSFTSDPEMEKDYRRYHSEMHICSSALVYSLGTIALFTSAISGLVALRFLQHGNHFVVHLICSCLITVETVVICILALVRPAYFIARPQIWQIMMVFYAITFEIFSWVLNGETTGDHYVFGLEADADAAMGFVYGVLLLQILATSGLRMQATLFLALVSSVAILALQISNPFGIRFTKAGKILVFTINFLLMWQLVFINRQLEISSRLQYLQLCALQDAKLKVELKTNPFRISNLARWFTSKKGEPRTSSLTSDRSSRFCELQNWQRTPTASNAAIMEVVQRMNFN